MLAIWRLTWAIWAGLLLGVVVGIGVGSAFGLIGSYTNGLEFEESEDEDEGQYRVLKS